MKTLIHLGLILMGPYLLFVYWRNSMREVSELNAAYQFNFE